MAGCIKNRLIRAVYLAIFVGAAFFSAVVSGDEPFKAAVVVNSDNAGHKHLLSTLQRELALIRSQQKDIRLAVYAEDGFENALVADKPDLLVSVGTLATLAAVKNSLDVPVLAVLIPRVSFESIVDEHIPGKNTLNQRRISAIYLDQPFSRRFALINRLMPTADEVGVVLGPSTYHYRSSLEKAAENYGLKLSLGVIRNESQLVPTLESVLRQSRVFLAVLDPLVFNRSNAQTVLLTAYRYRVPIIGISEAYIDAGALAAVYSTPEDIGKQLAETIDRLAGRRVFSLSAPDYPEYFSVKINEYYARKLGIRNINAGEMHRYLLGSADPVR